MQNTKTFASGGIFGRTPFLRLEIEAGFGLSVSDIFFVKTHVNLLEINEKTLLALGFNTPLPLNFEIYCNGKCYLGINSSNEPNCVGGTFLRSNSSLWVDYKNNEVILTF